MKKTYPQKLNCYNMKKWTCYETMSFYLLVLGFINIYGLCYNLS
jgi:hypothetical protein